MGRIYDALKRAAEGAKRQNEAPVRPRVAQRPPIPPEDEEPPVPSVEELQAVIGEDLHPSDTGSMHSFSRTTPVAPAPVPDVSPQDLGVVQEDREGPVKPQALDSPETYRERLRRALRANLAQVKDRMAKEGKHPFEGNWLTIREIRRLRWRMRLKDLGTLLQVLLLLAFIAGMGIAFYRALVGFFLPR